MNVRKPWGARLCDRSQRCNRLHTRSFLKSGFSHVLTLYNQLVIALNSFSWFPAVPISDSAENSAFCCCLLRLLILKCRGNKTFLTVTVNIITWQRQKECSQPPPMCQSAGSKKGTPWVPSDLQAGAYFRPAASRSCAALSVFSHGKCSRPK